MLSEQSSWKNIYSGIIVDCDSNMKNEDVIWCLT